MFRNIPLKPTILWGPRWGFLLHVGIAMLTETKIKNLRPQAKRVKYADAQGLSLWVEPKGAKSWYFRYRTPDGRQKDAFLGRWPDFSLAEARRMLDEMRAKLARGIDPSVERKMARAGGDAFKVIAGQWLDTKSDWKDSHRSSVISLLQRWVFPPLGDISVRDLTTPMILELCLRPIERRGIRETTKRALGNIRSILAYAVASGRLDRNPAADLRGVLAPPKSKHHRAITEPDELGDALRKIDLYRGSLVVETALKLTPMLFLRPGELRHLEWADYDQELAQFSIPGDRMKGGAPHVIPLATQARSLVETLRGFTGNGRFVFPSARSELRPMSENTIRVALRSIDVDAVPHGFRATARTMLDEIHEVPIEHIEHQLAHSVRDPNGRAYNRTRHLKQRAEMMQLWADYLDELRSLR